MSTPAAPTVAMVAVPPATAGTVIWRLGGELRVTVVVKAAFVIVPEGPMVLAEAEPLITAEAHHGNSPARSVRLTPDTAPRLARPEVLLTGHACAPEGQTLRWLAVRLAVFREQALLDKTIYVYGDDGGEVPFDRIPLVYERAHGGLGFQDNPLGTGTLELSSKPNLVHPERADRVACFAPIARTWLSRRKMVGSAARKALDAPIAEIPAGFDWSYFQASPADQRVDRLHGDEWVVLEGMSPTLPRLRTRLPSTRAVAYVQGLAGAPEGFALELSADTLRIDADRMGCTVVWRGDFPVPDEDALAALHVYAGVEAEGAPIVWPTAPQPEAAAAPGGDAEREEIIELDADAMVTLSTLTIDDGQVVLEESRPAVPFVPSVAPVSIAAEPTAPLPQAKRGSTLDLSTPRFGETLAVSELPPASLPFGRSVPPRMAGLGPPAAPEPPQWASQPPLPTTLDVAPPPEAPFVAIAAPSHAPSARGREATARGVRLENDTGLAFDVLPWGLRPARDCLAVIAKATADLVPGERAALHAEAAPLSGERHEGGSCVHPDDRAPFKVRADVVAVGRAHAPGGSARAMEVGFRFGADGEGFSRRILVFGDRVWRRAPAGAEPGPPEPFLTMPLAWSRAFGGAGHAPNPAGVGLVDRWRHAHALPPLPNLEDPDARLRVPSQRPAPACFAPRPAAFRPPPVERRAPWPCFPEDLDWTAHQAAPAAQQLPFLRGDEPFALAGMHRSLPVIEGALPGVRARCFASSPSGVVEVEMRLDTVVIDADEMKLSLVWRGALPVADEAAPAVTAVGLWVEEIGKEGVTLEQARARLG